MNHWRNPMVKNIRVSKQLADRIRATAEPALRAGALDDADVTSAAEFLADLGGALTNLEAPVAALLDAVARGNEELAVELQPLKNSLHRTARLFYAAAESA
ncbi:hypothetical protein OHB54_37440 [Streptomyces sp. NBC_01007]|nr:hypothetical protein OHB54_37440 [Streptomyces sp. NBC_01007]